MYIFLGIFYRKLLLFLFNIIEPIYNIDKSLPFNIFLMTIRVNDNQKYI